MSQKNLQSISHPVSSVNSSIESEQALIAACLDSARDDVMHKIDSMLMPTDFFEEAHQNIWRVRSSLASAGVPHDVVAVLDAGKKMGLFLGGPEYVMGLLHDDALKTMSPLSLSASACRIKDFSQLRAFTDTLATAQSLALGGTQSVDEILTYVADSIQNIRSSNASRNAGPMAIMQYVAGVLDQVVMRLEGEEPTNTVMFGFSSLDEKTGGMTDGDLIVLAGRPSMGKTAISLAITEHVAEVGGREVLFFSMEQSGIALAYRMIASRSRLDASRLKKGDLQGDDFSRFDTGAREVGELPIHIDETSELVISEIRARARIFKAKYPKCLIVVDYLQYVKAHRQAEPRVIVGEITTGLKGLAKELKCPVIALAQLSRGVEARTNKRPMMSDLGESGKIEQDADMILFVYRDEYYNPDTRDPGITEVIVSKNREGATGMAKLLFDRRTQKFQEL